jgi:hypothetical protein
VTVEEQGVSEPTDGDRERAAEVVAYYHRNYLTPATFEHVIAQALADERERTLAPFLRLAEAWGRGVHAFNDQGRFEAAALAAEVLRDLRRALSTAVDAPGESGKLDGGR